MKLIKKKKPVKETKPLTTKVQKAEVLRKEAVKADRANLRVIDKWMKANAPASQKWAEKNATSERIADEAYKAYYDYCHVTFSEDDLKMSGSQGKFLSKTFINRLNSLQEAKRKSKKR